MTIQPAGSATFCAGIFEHVGCLVVGPVGRALTGALGGENDHIAKETAMNTRREALAAAAYPC
jgi:hypothetical protein